MGNQREVAPTGVVMFVHSRALARYRPNPFITPGHAVYGTVYVQYSYIGSTLCTSFCVWCAIAPSSAVIPTFCACSTLLSVLCCTWFVPSFRRGVLPRYEISCNYTISFHASPQGKVLVCALPYCQLVSLSFQHLSPMTPTLSYISSFVLFTGSQDVWKPLCSMCWLLCGILWGGVPMGSYLSMLRG